MGLHGIPFDHGGMGHRRPGLVVMNLNTTTFAAWDFWRRRGVSDEHTRQWSVRSEQRSLRQKERPPFGLRRIWPVALLLVGYSPLAGMRPPRASPLAKLDATNIIVFGFMTTKLRPPPGILMRAQDTLDGTLTPALSHPMGEGARRAGEGSDVVDPSDSSVSVL